MEKRVVVHVDDIGVSPAANKAAFDLLHNGYASSGSIMIPGLGFSDVINKLQHNTNLDLGVHLTLTSEWSEEILKWKPTLHPSEVPSLIDDKGYFRSTVDDVLYKTNPEEIKKELINQIEIAQRTGISPSHIDSHMGILLHGKLFPIYQEIAELFKIQPFLAKSKPGDSLGNRFYGCDAYIDTMAAGGFKIFDHFDANSLYQGDKEFSSHCIDRIKSIKMGTTYFLLHVLDSDLCDAEKTSDYKSRQNEYHFFTSDIAEETFIQCNIEKITIKQL